MPKKIKGSVVVITGASSGIGRATALAFACQGATVVLGSRREKALQDLAADCRKVGGHALAVPVDVTNEKGLDKLARQAVENYCKIDVWVNNAAVTAFGRFSEIPLDIYRRVIDTNLFGYIYGARAVLPRFREQGTGVLINVSSIVGRLPQPYTSPYVISKHAIRALSLCLRQELNLEQAIDIHVCTVLPASIDTPIFQHGANYLGRVPQPMSPVYPAEKVAKAIVSLARNPKREVLVGNSGRLINLQHKFAPELTERVFGTMVDRMHFGRDSYPSSPGNVFEPTSEDPSISGGWKTNFLGVSTWNRLMSLIGVSGLISLLGTFVRRGAPTVREQVKVLRAA